MIKMIKVKLKQLNFDFDRGRIDQSHHPFCGGATNDVRITTRFEDNIFRAENVLAKHDETYMPREVAESLKEQGVWKGDSSK